MKKGGRRRRGLIREKERRGNDNVQFDVSAETRSGFHLYSRSNRFPYVEEEQLDYKTQGAFQGEHQFSLTIQKYFSLSSVKSI